MLAKSNRYEINKVQIGKLFFLLLFTIHCSLLKIKTPLDKKNSESNRICFWNINQSKLNLDSPILFSFISSCDIISFIEVNKAETNSVSVFETLTEKKGEPYICMENSPKQKENFIQEKYIICVKSEISSDIEKIEYEDINPSFTNAPPLFLLNIYEKKILVVPFHARPGNKKDLLDFNSVVDFAYKNFSDRRIFFGGDFNTDSVFHKLEFLLTIPFYLILEEMVSQSTTLSNQKNDVIFSDPRTVKNCKADVWRLHDIFPDKIKRDELEKISDHLPVSVDCILK
jgi:hypothetical protein